MLLVNIWKMWKKKNRIIFKQNKVDPEELFCMAKVSVWTWIKHKSPKVTLSYSD